MARAKITAPTHPAAERGRRLGALKGKGNKRTPVETAELLDLLAATIADLEQRLDRLEGGRS